MKKYVCSICGFVFDETLGIPEQGIAPNTLWETLPDDWVCPLCGAQKSEFEEVKEEIKEQSSVPKPIVAKKEYVGHQDNLKELSYGELSVLCSNLARGCEKQYRAKEAELYTKLADYYKSKVAKPAKQSFSDLLKVVAQNLDMHFVNANDAASIAADRGAKRVLTWTEKATRILKSLLERYEKEGNAMAENTNVYVCDICGFIYIGDTVPDICPVCKVPKLKILQVGR